MIGTPIVLSSPYTFTTAAVGAIGQPTDPSMFRAPDRNAMLVEGVQLWTKGYMPAVGIWHEWEIKLGRAQITNGFVPAALCTREEDAIGVNNVLVNRNAFVWNFARPMYLSAGATLTVRLRAGVASCAANVAIRGRVLPEGHPVPGSVQVPYACAFRPGIVDPTVAETDVKKYIYKSNAQDFSNPHANPLHIQRFVMGVSGKDPNGGGVSLDYRDWGYLIARYKAAPKVQLTDQDGNMILREAIRLSQLCGLSRSEWPVQFDLQPKAVVYAIFDQTHPIWADTNIVPFQVGLGMVGWRDVPISEVK